MYTVYTMLIYVSTLCYVTYWFSTIFFRDKNQLKMRKVAPNEKVNQTVKPRTL